MSSAIDFFHQNSRTVKRLIIILFFPAFLLSSNNTQAQTCQGPALLSADFNSGSLPSGWTVLSLDGNTVNENLSDKGYTGEWQMYTHYGRQCVTSASGYEDVGASNDYLITSAITLGQGPVCLSWKSARAHKTPAYSDELYDVRISTTTPDSAGLHEHPALISIQLFSI
jgi:hypothetical protein